MIAMAVGGTGFLWALFKKPDLIAILLFTTIIADINFDLPLMPLNFRAITTLCLLGKIVSENDKSIPSFLGVKYAWSISFFILYVLATTANNGLWAMDITKEFILSFIASYLAFHYYFKKNGYQIFKASIILAGLSCLADLGYTYVILGGFPVLRIYYLFTPSFAVCNHNFFGYICGAAFVFLLSDYLTTNSNNKINLLLMPAMFLGVLLSTSRSSLLILIIISLVLIARGLVSQQKGKKASTLVVITVACLCIVLFLFQIIQSFISTESDFFAQITARMIDEPMAMLNRALGNQYDANNLDSMDWRAEASSLAYNTYISFPPMEKLFGIGYNGFYFRDYGHGYDAHNGILLIMIEFGFIGFLIYFGILFSLIFKSLRYKIESPFTVLLIFMIMYVASHNKELTAFFAFLVTGSLAAQIYNKEVYDFEEETKFSFT